MRSRYVAIPLVYYYMFFCVDVAKGEIKSANCKSAELLAEKVTLDREVASLKSEVQNLKSQAVSHLIEVAEKSALERNLSSLQQELDLLKRSTQLTQAAQKKSQVEDEISQNKLKSLQAELEEERSQRLRTEELFQKASTDWESKKTTFELRSNTFRNKLRVTMEQLKACQAELHEFHTSGGPEPRLTPVRPGRKGFAKKSLKLSSIQKQDADSMIGTPGEMPAAKKVKRVLTLPGDKSTFSITPYLNRASSVVVESPHSETGHINVSRQKQNSFDHLDDHGEANDNAVFTRPPAPLAQPKSHVIGPRAKPSKNVSSMRIRRISPSLEDVSELAENDEIDPLLDEKSTRTIAEAPKQSNDHLLLADPIRKSAEIQKRKRKVLGGRLHEPMLDDSRNKGLEGDQTRGFREACPAQLSLTSRRTFGAISPLKSKMRPMLDAVA